MFTMYRYVISSKGINEALVVAEKMVQQTKEEFDVNWSDRYSQNQEFWTLEDITVRLQVSYFC
jgi:hypothetical protein